MEKFGGVLNLDCEYRLGKDVYRWSSNVLAELPFNSNGNNSYNIEGPFILNNSVAYIIGMNAIDKNVLRFTVLAKDNTIIEYNLLNDTNTNDYYGSWNMFKDNKLHFGGYAKISVKPVKDSIYNADKRIEMYGHNRFYSQYPNVVSNLLLTKKPTINDYKFEKSNEMYVYSKNYFVTERTIVQNLLVKKI